jgi:T5SS/PEP-CTERM-associated repeat protein
MKSVLRYWLVVCVVAVGVLCSSARAETRTFDNDALDNDWFNPLNWDPDGGPATSDELIVNEGVPTTTQLVETSNGGSVLLDGANAGAELGQVDVGRSGMGTFTVGDGADLHTSSSTFIGWFDGSTGDMLVTGDDTTWTADALVGVGRGFNNDALTSGSLTTSDHADFDGVGIEVGGRFNAEGTLTVDNATATTSSSVTIGAFGIADAFVSNGGVLESTGSISINIGNGSTAEGELYVNGGMVTSASGMNIGSSGTGLLDISNGGMVDAGNNTVSVAAAVGSSGDLYVDGEGSTFTVNSGIQVGNRDIGYVEVTGGADITNSSTFFGVFGEFADGWGWIDGPGSTWTTTGQTAIGYEGVGMLEITNGGLFDGFQTQIGDEDTGDGELYVYDGGVYDGSDILYVGSSGLGFLTIETGGMVENDGRGAIGVSNGSEGDAFIADPGSIWTVNNELLVGWQGTGYLTIVDGGVVNSDTGIIAQGLNSYGDVAVAGDGAQWNNTGDLTVGSLSEGIMVVTEGGHVTSVNSFVASSTDAIGSVFVGLPSVDGAEAQWNMTGSLYVGGPSFAGQGDGLVTLDDGGAINADISAVVWDTGVLEMFGGTLNTGTLDIDGTFDFLGGTLIAEVVDGDLTNQGGTVAPGASPGTTTINGDYTQLEGATLEIELGGLTPGTEHDQLIVDGAMLDLAGTLGLVHLSEYDLNVGDMFDVVTFTGALDGMFDAVTTSSQNGLQFDVDVIYGAGVITVEVLSITTALLGDYNGDDIVDAADYVVWRKTDGTPEGYDEWRANYGATLSNLGSGSGTTSSFNAVVPEPTSLLLVVIAACAVLSHGIRKVH